MDFSTLIVLVLAGNGGCLGRPALNSTINCNGTLDAVRFIDTIAEQVSSRQKFPIKSADYTEFSGLAALGTQRMVILRGSLAISAG